MSSCLGRRRLTFASSPWLCGGCHTWFGADGKVSIKRWYLSPYVEKSFNSKVIKCFVSELSRKGFSCFGIPMFYVYMLWTFYVRFLYFEWLCYIPSNLICFDFFEWEKLLPVSDGEHIKIILHCRVPTRFTDINEHKTPIVFVVITWDDDIMPPFIFPRGLRRNMEAYIKFLLLVTLPWFECMATGRIYISQPDSAPGRTNKRIRSWLF